MRSRSSILVAATLLVAGTHPSVAAQTLPAGPQVLTFLSQVDDAEQP